MIARWCISVLIFSLTLFGVISQHQIAKPNQEIVLQFQDVHLTSKQTENTVAIVKQQLQDLGAKNIKVLSQGNSKLKITYFSNTDIISIKKVLSEDNCVALQLKTQAKEPSNFPFQDNELTYNLDVFEIQKDQNSGWDLDGAISLEVEPKSDRFVDPNYLFIENIGYQYQENLLQIAYKIRKEVTLQISDPLHIIPEVRAGPIC